MRRAQAQDGPFRSEADRFDPDRFDPRRREALAAVPKLCAGVVCAGVVSAGAMVAPAAADPADERPQAGDHLVAAGEVDAAHPDAAQPLAPEDVTAALIAWPMDAAARVVRTGSRLNKVLLVRLDPATLAGPTSARAASGVVAYSAICPHAGCEVTGLIADRGIFECPCHNSKFDPRDAAAVIEGPATRALAALPLKIVGGKLAVAGPFVGRLGIAPA
jgi:Rieske Fe-S protein